MLVGDEIYVNDFKRTYAEAYRRGFMDGFNERGYLLTYVRNDHIENQNDHIEKQADAPQTDCYMCKWLGEVDVCGRCRNRNLFAEADTEPKPKDEPQTDCPWK